MPFDPAKISSAISLSNSDRTATKSLMVPDVGRALAVAGHDTSNPNAVTYFEITADTAVAGCRFGVAQNANLDSDLGADATSWGWDAAGETYHNGVSANTDYDAISSGDRICGILKGDSLWFGTVQGDGTIKFQAASDPAEEESPAYDNLTGTVYPAVSLDSAMTPTQAVTLYTAEVDWDGYNPFDGGFAVWDSVKRAEHVGYGLVTAMFGHLRPGSTTHWLNDLGHVKALGVGGISQGTDGTTQFFNFGTGTADTRRLDFGPRSPQSRMGFAQNSGNVFFMLARLTLSEGADVVDFQRLYDISDAGSGSDGIATVIQESGDNAIGFFIDGGASSRSGNGVDADGFFDVGVNQARGILIDRLETFDVGMKLHWLAGGVIVESQAGPGALVQITHDITTRAAFGNFNHSTGKNLRSVRVDYFALYDTVPADAAQILAMYNDLEAANNAAPASNPWRPWFGIKGHR